jgi:hypothetical protein
MTKVAKNVSFKNHPVTTALGILFVSFSLVLFTAPVFFEVKSQLEWWLPASLLILGLLLIGSPDTLFASLSKVVDKKAGEV